MQYRRAFIPGAAYFFTVVTYQRRPILASADAIDTLRQAMRHVRSQRPFTIDAMIVLPDHIHCIWTLPPGDSDFANRWRLIKSKFTRNCELRLRGVADDARARKSGQAIWQHRYWEHLLRDEEDFIRHVEYIHYNPVKHGLVKSPIEWPYSSFHGYVRKGYYSNDWGSDVVDIAGIGRE